MRLDPFRMQILTLSLDSQVVLLVLGLVVAGLMVRQATRQAEIDLGTGHWWDLVFTAVVGGRLVWVVTHADYYLRQPLQIVVILNGGVHAIGLVLGAAYGTWRLASGDTTLPWRRVADLLALGVLTMFLFERVGCALTTCGTGPVSALPWAILRGDDWRAPMALGQVIILAAALVIAAQILRVRGAAFVAMLAALALVDTVALAAGRATVDDAVALAILTASYGLTAWYSPEPRSLGSGRRPER